MITLQGVKASVGPPVNHDQLKALYKKDSILYTFQLQAVDSLISAANNWPPEIQDLLTRFAALFEEPKELPPSRHGDHQIPLIARAQPFRL